MLSRTLLTVAVLFPLLGFFGCGTCCDRASGPAQSPERAAVPAPTGPAGAPAAAAPVNSICPVTGDAVDPKVRTSVYNGQTIGFCCAGCKPKFDANPASYAGAIR